MRFPNRGDPGDSPGCRLHAMSSIVSLRQILECKSWRTMPKQMAPSWFRVYELPSFVSFSHRVHVENGNTCTECHGEAAQEERIYKATDISMAR